MLRDGSGAFIIGKAGEALANRDLVYPNASGEWMKADANVVTDMPVIGMALGPIISGNYGKILLRGFIGLASWTWTPGSALYATNTAGVISDTPPTLGIRQTVGYALESDLIYLDRGSIENVIYWSAVNRTTYGVIANTSRTESLINGEWWVVDASPSQTMLDNFTGLFDITGLGVPVIVGNYAYYAVKTGAGTFNTNDGPSAGIRITTAAALNDDMLLTNGDGTASRFTWNPLNEVWLHFHYRFPTAPDAANVYYLGGLWQDANNYVCLRYDTAVDTNLRLVTRAAAAETLTVLGALDTSWHDVYMKFTAGEVRFTLEDTGTVTVVTTNVPTGNFTWYNYLKTLTTAAKSVDISHLTLVQSIL